METINFTNFGRNMAETVANLFDDIPADYNATSYGCEDIVEEWERNKGIPFDEKFKGIPGYDAEQHCIVLSNKLFREPDYDRAREILIDYLLGVCDCRVRDTFEGKDSDYWADVYRTTTTQLNIIDKLPATCLNYHGVKELRVLRNKAYDIWTKLSIYTGESNAEYVCRKSVIAILKAHVNEQFVSEETAKSLNEVYPELKVGRGKKLSKVVRRFCDITKASKDEQFERMFAQFADAINPIELNETLVISWNLLDYLTMSNGTNWTSCHSLGFDDGEYGCFSSGTLSYALDGTSLIVYAISKDEDMTKPLWTIPKVHRQMFHVSENGMTLLQARLYPDDQSDWGRSVEFGAYKQYREIVQHIVAKAFNLPNLWGNKRGTDACRDYVRCTSGTHYTDYYHYENCNVSHNKSSDEKFTLCIGHKPICPSCGEEHSRMECCTCYRCEKGEVICSACGCRVDEDDAERIGDEWYCHDCCDYCDYHREYERNAGSNYIRGYGDVCDSALDEMLGNEDAFECEECGEYVISDYTVEVTDKETGEVHFYCDHCR